MDFDGLIKRIGEPAMNSILDDCEKRAKIKIITTTPLKMRWKSMMQKPKQYSNENQQNSKR